MSLLVWIALSGAVPVVCDPQAAARLVEDARIDERRAPVTHPELMPGLALASVSSDDPLHDALAGLCRASESVSVAPVDVWEDTLFSAYTYRITGSQTLGCALAQRTVTVSVGISAEQAPVYSLRGQSPVTTTPIGECEVVSTWREETVIDGEGGPVRLVLVVDRTIDDIHDSKVVVRRASPAGWSEQPIAAPAPARYLEGRSGPQLALAEIADGPVWVVAHADRSVVGGECSAVMGQTVWRFSDDGWTPTSGREAMALLARHGLWRLAGSDGWLHIVAQDDEGNEEVLAYRATRLGRRYPEPLVDFVSSDLPGLNAGFTVIAPAPFATQERADDARRAWRSMHRHYVKRAWTQPDPCADTTP